MTEESGGSTFGVAHAHFVLALLITVGGAWFYEVRSTSGLEKQLEQKQADSVNAINARNRADDVMNARLTELERSLRNCQH